MARAGASALELKHLHPARRRRTFVAGARTALCDDRPACLRRVKIPVSVKLAMRFTNVVAMAAALESVGGEGCGAVQPFLRTGRGCRADDLRPKGSPYSEASGCATYCARRRSASVRCRVWISPFRRACTTAAGGGQRRFFAVLRPSRSARRSTAKGFDVIARMNEVDRRLGGASRHHGARRIQGAGSVSAKRLGFFQRVQYMNISPERIDFSDKAAGRNSVEFRPACLVGIVLPMPVRPRPSPCRSRKVVPRLFHHLDHAVERDAVSAVGEGRIEVGVDRAGRSVGVAFDAGSAPVRIRDRRSCQMVFEPHFGGILDLRGGCLQLVGCGGAMAQATPTSPWQPPRRPRIEALCFDGICRTSRGQRAVDACVGETRSSLRRWYNTAGTTPLDPQVGAVTIRHLKRSLRLRPMRRRRPDRAIRLYL